IPEQILLRRLSAFRGGWTLEAAERVGAGSDLVTEDVLDILGHLVDKSLVVLDESHDSPRYKFLETIRQYAREKLAASGETDAVSARHRAAILELLLSRPADGQPGQGEWQARVARDHGNVAEAVATSIA